MEKIVSFLDQANVKIGEWVSWLNTLLVLLICVDVLFRYVFNFSKTWIIDLEWHLFAAVFLLGAAYTLKSDQHVRVDVFYTHFSEKKKSIINLIGTVCLLIPWSILIISKSWNYAVNSWMIGEGSPDPGGLPARYIIKMVIVVAFVLLLIQGLVMIFRSVQKLIR